jgi:hypothetical protein
MSTGTLKSIDGYVLYYRWRRSNDVQATTCLYGMCVHAYLLYHVGETLHFHDRSPRYSCVKEETHDERSRGYYSSYGIGPRDHWLVALNLLYGGRGRASEVQTYLLAVVALLAAVHVTYGVVLLLKAKAVVSEPLPLFRYFVAIPFCDMHPRDPLR